jgi:hypothetical protein
MLTNHAYKHSMNSLFIFYGLGNLIVQVQGKRPSNGNFFIRFAVRWGIQKG